MSGILNQITAVLYDWLVWSRIMFYLMPLIEPFYIIIGSYRMRKDVIKDPDGNTINVLLLNGRILPPFGETRFSFIKEFKVRDDDVMLCSYPKTGTHFAYEVIRMLRLGKAELSPKGKAQGGMIDAVPDIFMDSMPSPRILNSHLLFEELPKQLFEKKTKIVLTIRCPKDTVVSYYNHVKAMSDLYEYNGNFDNIFRMFMNGTVEYGDYFEYYKAWDKVMRQSNSSSNSDNKTNEIFLLSFEDLKENPVVQIKELAKFLDITITDTFAEQIAVASSFKNTKKKRPNNGLIRKGQVGDWTNWLTNEQNAEMDKAWREKMTDFRRGAMKDGYKQAW